MSTSTPVAPGSTELAAEPFADLLAERLQSTRQQIRRTRWRAGACWVGLAGLLAIGALATIDYFAELPFGARALGLGGLIAAVAAGLYAIQRRFISPMTLSKAAAEAESRVGEFGQRVRTTLDYHQLRPAPAQASPRLLAALHRQTAQLARQVDWERVVDRRPALLAFAAAALALTGFCLPVILVPEYRTALARAMLLPAEYTHVEFTPHEQTAKFGDSVKIDVTIAGRPVRSAIVRHRPAGSTDDAWTTTDLAHPDEQATAQSEKLEPMAPVVLQGVFTAMIENLERDLDVEVLAGPRQLPLGRVTVLQPLTLEHAVAHIVPPAYTGRPEETVESLELNVLEGSNVELRLDLNRRAVEGSLVPVADAGKNDDVPHPAVSPLRLAISDNALVGTLSDLRQGGSYNVSAKAADGMSLVPVPVRIRVRLDQKPDIKFLAPQEDLNVIATTEVAVAAEVADDLGLYKVGIQYRLDDGELRTLWEGSGEGSTEPLRAASLLMLEDLNATFRNAVSYYAFAEDNYFGSPRRVTSELRFIDIRPFKIDYQVVDSEGGSCSGSVSLEELIHSQRTNLVAAFAARQEPSISPEDAEKLRRGEAALHEQTQEFVQGVEARIGPVPTLEDAVAAMDAAVVGLSEQKIDQAVESEQWALACLVQARENLRQKLKNSSSQASNCRKFDRDFRQKLRMPKKKDSTEEKLAQARKQLDELAKRERKWGHQAQQCCNSPSSSGSPTQQPSDGAPPPGEPQADQQPSAEELAQAQEQLRKDLDALKQQLAALPEAAGAAQKQAEHADQAMQQAKDELQAKRGDAAEKAAENSAEKIEQLADQLAAMSASDFGQRLDEAHRQAQDITRRQENMARELGAPEPKADGQEPGGRSGELRDDQSGETAGKSTRPGAELGREEESLAIRAEMLGELLDKLRRDSTGESASVRGKLDAAVTSAPPGQIAGEMRQAADDLKADRTRQAARGAASARDELNELAQALAAVRAAQSQPQLAELLKLEEQFAQLVQQAQRLQGASPNQQGELPQKWQELAEKLARVAQLDRRLADALEHMQFQPNGGQPPPQGHYSWRELADFHGTREVAKALQIKIQEAILAGALVDADAPVPAEYKPLVEKYYKTLSDDLR
ncbi:MAG TPA: hypothetical protein VFI31_17840 [Pirellulales bacterium]|nr:hypothetical protein [Pirellulales bacterium]